MDYKQKYLKYKAKYLDLKQQIGGDGYEKYDPVRDLEKNIKLLIKNINEDKTINNKKDRITEVYNNKLKYELDSLKIIENIKKIEFLSKSKECTKYKYIIEFIKLFDPKQKNMKKAFEEKLKKLTDKDKKIILNEDNILLQTALCLKVDIDIIKLIIDDPNFDIKTLDTLNGNNFFPISIASKMNLSSDIKKLLITNYNINYVYDNGNTILVDFIQDLSNKRWINNWTYKEPKWNENWTDDEIFFRLLIDKNKEILDIKNTKNGNIPLIYAINMAVPFEIIKLLTTDKNKDFTNDYGNTVIDILFIHFMTHFNKLYYPSQFNQPAQYHNNLYSIIAEKFIAECTKIVKFLCTDKNKDFQNKDGNTPLHLAINLFKDIDRNTQIFEIINKFIHTVMDELITDKNKDFQNKDDYTPLHLIIKKGQIDKKLITAKNKNIQHTQDNNTPLHYALLNGAPDFIVIELISEENKKLNNYDNQTPLSIAINTKRSASVIKLLK